MTKWELSALNMQKGVNTSELPTVQTLSNYTPRHSDNFMCLQFKIKITILPTQCVTGFVYDSCN